MQVAETHVAGRSCGLIGQSTCFIEADYILIMLHERSETSRETVILYLATMSSNSKSNDHPTEHQSVLDDSRRVSPRQRYRAREQQQRSNGEEEKKPMGKYVSFL